MPIGWRMRVDVDPGACAAEYSPLSACGMPQANSITSSPRWMSPFASRRPCRARGEQVRERVHLGLDQLLKRNSTRARRCGLVAGPGRLRCERGGDRALDIGRGAEPHLRLHAAVVRDRTRRRAGRSAEAHRRR
jgi:hypothetical protein